MNEINEMKETESEARATAETEKPAAKTRQSGGKHMLAKRVTSISISDTDIKLTVVRGSVVEKWVACPLEPGMVVNGIVQDSDSLSAMLKGLFRDHKVQTNKLILGLSGLHAITRIITLPRVSQKVLREAIIYEADRELPVPIDSIYLFWQIIERNPQEMKVFLIAYARNTIDALMNTLRKAGVKPYLLELAPLAVARCVNSPTSIVFDVRPGELDIVVTINSIPELIRSVPLPPYNLIEENLTVILPILLDELQRTITFCKSARSIDSLPVFGFGDLDKEIFESLSTALNHPITLSSPPLHYPPEFSPDTCSVNLGLVLGKVKLPDYAFSRRVNINLLPESYKTRILTPKLLIAAGTTIALGILAAVFVLFLMASSETDAVRSDLDTAKLIQTQQQNAQLALKRDVNTLKAKADQSAAELASLRGSKSKLEADQTSINNDLIDLEEVLTSLPSGVSLDLSSDTGSTYLTLSGELATQDLVVDYVRTLENSGLFSNIVLSMDGTTFTLDLQKVD